MIKKDDAGPGPGSVDFLRHGRTETGNIFRGITDDPLSETGWLQMTEAVGTQRWDRILSSPLSRCRDFAAQQAERSNLELEVDERLREYGFGDWDGKTYEEVMRCDGRLVENFFADPYRHTPPNGEPFADFKERVLQVWREMVDQSPTGRTLVVSHGGTIMTILAEILGVDRLHGKIEMSYSCLTRIRLDQGGRRPRLIFHR